MSILTNIPINKIKPTAGFLLVKPVDQELKTSSGIYLAETKTEEVRIVKGIVMSTGDDTYKNSIKISCPAVEGDIILYKSSWNSSEINLEGEKYNIISFDDVLATIK